MNEDNFRRSGPSSDPKKKNHKFWFDFVCDFLSDDPGAGNLVKVKMDGEQLIVCFTDLDEISSLYCDYKKQTDNKDLKRDNRSKKDNLKNIFVLLVKDGLLKKIGAGTEYDKEYLKYEILDSELSRALSMKYSFPRKRKMKCEHGETSTDTGIEPEYHRRLPKKALKNFSDSESSTDTEDVFLSDASNFNEAPNDDPLVINVYNPEAVDKIQKIVPNKCSLKGDCSFVIMANQVLPVGIYTVNFGDYGSCKASGTGMDKCLHGLESERIPPATKSDTHEITVKVFDETRQILGECCLIYENEFEDLASVFFKPTYNDLDGSNTAYNLSSTWTKTESSSGAKCTSAWNERFGSCPINTTMLVYLCNEMAKRGDEPFLSALNKLGIMGKVLEKHYKYLAKTAREHGHCEFAAKIETFSRKPFNDHAMVTLTFGNLLDAVSQERLLPNCDPDSDDDLKTCASGYKGDCDSEDDACEPHRSERLHTGDLLQNEEYIIKTSPSYVYSLQLPIETRFIKKVRKAMTEDVKISAYRSLLHKNLRTRNAKFVNEDQKILNLAKDEVSKNASTEMPEKINETFASYMRSIGNIVCGKVHLGTCFLVTPALVITNYHVYRMIQEKRRKQGNPNLPITIWFDYLHDRPTANIVKVEVDEEQDSKLENPYLDYKFFRVRQNELLKNRVPLGPMVRNWQLPDGRVVIVGHPNGEAIQDEVCVVVGYRAMLERIKNGCGGSAGVHMTNQQLLQATGDYHGSLSYGNVFFAGFSGSPVFDLNGNIVAMHVQRYTLANSRKYSLMEFGVQFLSVWRDMQQQHGEIIVNQIFPNFKLQSVTMKVKELYVPKVENEETPASWKWKEKSIVHREKIRKLREYARTHPKEIKEVNGVRFCCMDEFLIGKGSYGTQVFVGLGKDGVEKAVKRLPRFVCSSLAEQEKKVLYGLNPKKSEYLVKYWVLEEQSDKYFSVFISDLCEETLRNFVQRSSNTDLVTTAPDIIQQILKGLDDLHRDPNPILHRDLKPSNILRNIKGNWLLADFGISRILTEDETTYVGTPMGTEGWKAAESCSSEAMINDSMVSNVRYKKASDIQVLGMVAFYILTNGEHPFGGKPDRLRNLLDGKPVGLVRLKDAAAKDLITWMLSHHPKDRPPADEALKHPYLQPAKQQFELLCKVGNQPEIKAQDVKSDVVRKLNSDLRDWQGTVAPDVLRYLSTASLKRKRSRYVPSLMDCLRFIQNITENKHDYNCSRQQQEVLHIVGNPQDYLLNLFPCLPAEVHRIIRSCDWKERDDLRKYFI